MIPLFAIAVLLASALLFVLQPIAGKLLLPMLGGSPGVWNAVMLFFQVMLLAGYLYAHLLRKAGSVWRQCAIHAALCVAAVLTLPIAIRETVLPTGGAEAVRALALLLGLCGAPAFVLCSASPLLQSWIATTRRSAARNPWFLYAASNVGSMGALLAYPFMIEPALTLTTQRSVWSALFMLLALVMTACGVWAARVPAADAVRAAPPSPAPRWSRRLMWLVLAMVPASMSIAVTQYITTDVASAPFLWVLPLAVYLLTYILAFGTRGAAIGDWSGQRLPLAAAVVSVMLLYSLRSPFYAVVPIHLALLFFAAMSCHGRLAALRPEPARLTEFYVILALGGALGGAFNTLLAPHLFHSIAEYPIAIVACCLLRASTLRIRRDPARPRRLLAIEVLCWIPVALILPVDLALERDILVASGIAEGWSNRLAWTLPVVLALVVMRFRLRFASAVAIILAIPLVSPQSASVLHVERTFFGVHRVAQTGDDTIRFNELYHGRTLHGVQRLDGLSPPEPLAYYTREGPLGDVFRVLDARAEEQNVAAVGLGIGAVAAYATPTRRVTFYEIDPAVIRIASNTTWFTFLSSAAPRATVVEGDARTSLARAEPASFDLIILDAFSSDAIPTHLMTREALALYTRALTPSGIIAWHISNHFLDLEPVVTALARDAGLIALVRADEPEEPEEAAGRWSSLYVVLARDQAALGTIASNPRWKTSEPRDTSRLWTDDYCDVPGALIVGDTDRER